MPSDDAPPARSAVSDVLVIVVEYDRSDLTAQLLTSLDEPWPVVLVRTGTTTGAASSYPFLAVIDRPDNPGFAEAVNEGLRLGLSQGYRYFFVCNNDLVLEPGTLATLRDVLERHHRVGAVSPVITFYPEVDRVWYAGGTLWGDLLVPRHPGYTHRLKRYPPLFTTEYLSGCALLVRREVLCDAGLVPEGYFLYMEDVEWSIRMRQAGWILAVVGQPLVHHVASASSGGVDGRLPNPLSARLNARNAWIVRKRLALGPAFFVGQFLIRLPYYMVMSAVRRRPDIAWAYLRGLWEGIRC